MKKNIAIIILILTTLFFVVYAQIQTAFAQEALEAANLAKQALEKCETGV